MGGMALFARPGFWKFSYKYNRITQAIGVILAFTGRKMFYFN
jgi:hypothetical protein